jgi:hypothetical protein
MDIKQVGGSGTAQNGDKWWALVKTVVILILILSVKIPCRQLRGYQRFGRT